MNDHVEEAAQAAYEKCQALYRAANMPEIELVDDKWDGAAEPTREHWRAVIRAALATLK